MKTYKTALIVCNAPLPGRTRLQELLSVKPLVVCADGGADRLLRLGLMPDFIVGDIDSLTARSRKKVPPKRILRVVRQDNSDLEKALDFVLRRGIRKVTVIGATGRRPDHTYGNFSILLRYHQRIDIELVDAWCTTRLIDGRTILPLKRGTTLSLMPIGRCEGVVTRGLAYPLDDEILQPGVRESLSNVVTESPVQIELRTGSILLFVVRKR